VTLAIDTSALVAILRAEAEAPLIVDALGRSPRHVMSAGTYLEARLVTARRGSETDRLAALIDGAAIEIVPVTPDDARAAAVAFERFGRGSGHRANLNFGDCFAYALAMTRQVPLLFKGDDFIHTDVTPALPAAGAGA
jgi:ribonuclease VapC